MRDDSFGIGAVVGTTHIYILFGNDHASAAWRQIIWRLQTIYCLPRNHELVRWLLLAQVEIAVYTGDKTHVPNRGYLAVSRFGMI